VKEIIDSGALGHVHTVYGMAPGWMMHLISHLIDYMRWYDGESPAQWVMGQAAGRGKLGDLHPSPDYIGGFIQFANGVRGVVECGVGAPDVPEVDYWWRKCRIGAQGTDGFAEVLRQRLHELRPGYATVHPGNGRLAGRMTARSIRAISRVLVLDLKS
jgi:predicted dehydrogenase